MKIEKLEAIRGFVALYIVFHHIVAFNHLQDKYLSLKIIFMHPQEAVLVFFLLSGFVIYLSAYNSKNLTFYKYIKKRFIRIYPITIATFAISTIIFLFESYKFTLLDVKIFTGNLFMLQDDQAQPGLIVPTYLKNYPLWSLSYEWWFYVMFFPLFLIFKKTRVKKVLPSIYIVLTISLVGWSLFLISPNHVFLVLTYFMLWWAGVACAEIYLQHKDFTFTNLKHVFIALSVVTIVISVPIIDGFFFMHKTLAQINGPYPISTYLHYYADTLVFLVVGLIWWKYKLAGFDVLLGKFKIIAPISFALYIVHFPFIWLSIPFITNFYLLYFVKLCLIGFTSYLLEIKMQPVLNKLFKNRIQKNKLELETQAF